MSWDLTYWRGDITSAPPDVWDALRHDQSVSEVEPLSIPVIRDAFAREYGDEISFADLELDDGTHALEVRGRGFEGLLREGDPYLYLTCSFGLVNDDAWLTSIVRAGVFGELWVFDPQSGCWWPPLAAADPNREVWDVWRFARGPDAIDFFETDGRRDPLPVSEKPPSASESDE